MSDTYENVEVYGATGEDGRPENIPEKFWKPQEGETAAHIDQGAMLAEYNYRTQQIGAADGMFGAPEENYSKPEFELPEGVEYELKDDDPMLASFAEFAKERNLSDKAYGEIANWYIGQQAQQQVADKAFLAGEMDKLGPNGKGMEMVNAFTQQMENLTKDLPEAERDELMKGMKDSLYSAESYKFLSYLTNNMQPAKLPSLDLTEAGGLTKEKVREMQNVELTEGPNKGKRRYEVDAAYRAEVRAAWSQVAGDAEKREEISFTK